jgi:hypothetical protein
VGGARSGACLDHPVKVGVAGSNPVRSRETPGQDRWEPASCMCAGRSTAAAAGSGPWSLFTEVDTCFAVQFDGARFRCVMDGVAGARDDLSSSPSVDIVNGTPDGPGPDTMYDTWVNGRTGSAARRSTTRRSCGSRTRRTEGTRSRRPSSRSLRVIGRCIRRSPSLRTGRICTSCTTRSRRRTGTTRPIRAVSWASSALGDDGLGSTRPVERSPSRSAGRPAGLRAEEHRPGVHRRLRVRGCDERLRRGRVERRTPGGAVRRRERVAPGRPGRRTTR